MENAAWLCGYHEVEVEKDSGYHNLGFNLSNESFLWWCEDDH